MRTAKREVQISPGWRAKTAKLLLSKDEAKTAAEVEIVRGKLVQLKKPVMEKDLLRVQGGFIEITTGECVNTIFLRDLWYF